jgi:hypothetical protein
VDDLNPQRRRLAGGNATAHGGATQAALRARGVFPVAIIDAQAKQRSLSYLVIGGHAINFYCEPRATLDVDFLVRKADQTSWSELLLAEGFKLMHDAGTFVQFSPPYGVEWRLDLMLVNDQTFEKLKQDAQPVQVLGISTLVPRPEHLIAMKLHALKHGHAKRFEKDLGDVLSLIRSASLNARSESFRRLVEQFGTMELYERILEKID